MGTLLTVGVSLVLYSWLLCLISTVLPLWTYQDQGAQQVHAGLWKTCTIHGGNSHCETITAGWINTVRAFMVMAVIVLFAGMVTGCLTLQDDSKPKVSLLSTLAVLIGGFMVMIAVIIYGVKNGDNRSYFSAGFCLSIMSSVSAFLAVLLLVVNVRRSSGYGGYTPIGSYSAD